MMLHWLYLTSQIVVATVCIILGSYILQADSRSPRNIHFVVNSALLFLVIISTILIQLASDDKTGKIFQGIYNILLILFLLASLSFSMLFAGKKPGLPLLAVVVPLSMMVFVIFLTRVQSLLILTRVSGLWVYEMQEPLFWYLLYTPLLACIIIAMLVTLQRFSRSANTNKERLQARTMTTAILISCVGGYVFLMILPLIRVYRMPLLTPYFFAIYLYGVFFALNKYKLMVYSIRDCSREILSQIGDALILTDHRLHIIEIGGSAGKLLSDRIGGQTGRSLGELVRLNRELENRLKGLVDGTEAPFTVRVTFATGEGVITDTFFSRVTDRFGDFSALLAVCRETRGIPELKRYFKLTDREMELVLLTITGLSNSSIAEKLGIGRRTVETHQINIYNKLGIGNKLELMTVTADFGIKS